MLCLLRCLQDVLKMSWKQQVVTLKTFSRHVFMTHSRHLGDKKIFTGRTETDENVSLTESYEDLDENLDDNSDE